MTLKHAAAFTALFNDPFVANWRSDSTLSTPWFWTP